ncbi:hypothetical protein M514_10464 [Trichuris suis]|uniref:Uncharacterized protein n=1 Tax=Trichuris suis TaxID=68888 RepID=A0A085LUN4_9BILA|nr:hypothetical protein M513_10464 [Trichuris suis]KFD70669.1 hypothetical protein M514_10464 [Trichuris suis]
MAQPTVSFDAEDLPPPSYYQRVKENGPLIGAQTASLQCPSEEWWKAPEFIPRSLQTVPDGEAPLSDDICAPTVPYDCVESDQALFSHDSYGDLDRSLADRLSMSTPILTPHSIGIPRLLDARPAPAAPFFPVPVWTQNQRPIPPLVPPHMFPLRINPTTAAAAAAALSLKSAASSVPAGYSANFTTLNAGLGPPIPAIVLKKKRKKKNRKLKGLSLTDIKDDEDDRLALLNGTDARTDRASSCGSTGDGQSLSKSELDMTGVEEQQDCLEVIQNGPLKGAADACSCPDLTEAQRRQLLDEFNAQMEHFEMQSNPVVQQTLQELLVDEGKGGAGIRSPRVRELDQQILKEMQRQWQSEGKRYPIVASQGGQEQAESSECTDLYNALTSDLFDSANGKGDHFRGQPVKSIREEIEEKTFFQHRPQWRSLNADTKPNGSMPLSTVVQYQAGSFVTEVNSDNPSASLITKKLSRLIPRATFVEEEMADDEVHMFINAADSEEIDFPNVRQTVYPYQALPTNDTRQTVVLQRRHSVPDTTEPFFKRKTRVCCVLM